MTVHRARPGTSPAPGAGERFRPFPPPLAKRLVSLEVDKEERTTGALDKTAKDKVSDHAPLIATFADS